MKSKRVIRPKVVAGGSAVPLGDNFYFMNGRKHKDGGIDIGSDPKTGLEVEGNEIVKMTNKEVKVFSSVPFLDGISPADRLLQGDNPTKVFKAQENFKKVNNLNDDGSNKKTMKSNKYVLGGPKPKSKAKPKTTIPKILNRNILGALPASATGRIDNYKSQEFDDDYVEGMNKSMAFAAQNINTDSAITPPPKTNNFFTRAGDSIGEFFKEDPNRLNDAIGLGSNILGSIASAGINKKTLDKMKFAPQPVARQAAKLKTTININPQLDKMRESVAAYERDIDNNTASSRVALARKQRGRIANTMQTNDLYGNKENMETELINQDRFNQQRVADANTSDYNRWSEGKANFDNAINEKRSENVIGLVENLNAGVQDIITRSEKRRSTRDTMLAMSAGSPNVNPRILKDLGVNSITDKMVADWDKANAKKGKKSKNNS